MCFVSIRFSQDADLLNTSMVPTMPEDIRNRLLGPDEIFKKSPLTVAEEAKFEEKLHTRTELILGTTGIHFAANLLDPHLHGRDLTSEEVIQGSFCGNIFVELTTWAIRNLRNVYPHVLSHDYDESFTIVLK
jgi:hypothetical protein